MYWVFRITRLAPRLVEVDLDFEPPCGVSVKSIPISGGCRFASRHDALAWIEDVALVNGIDKRKILVEGWVD